MNMRCDFCGKIKKKIYFAIGATNRKIDWCLIEGTGKLACPDCYEIGAKEAKKLFDSLLVQ